MLEENMKIPRMEEFLDKEEIRKIGKARQHFLERTITIIIAALGLIAALAWDEALKSLFEKIFGPLSTSGEKLIYALVITALASVVSIILGRRFFFRKENPRH